MKHVVLTACAAVLLATTAPASEFRAFRPILGPKMAGGGPAAGAGSAVAPARMRPVSRNIAETAMEKIIAAWNGNRIDSVLSDSFFDKSRLADSMNGKVPRDARLSVLAIQAVQTLGQRVESGPQGKLLVSTISITAKTQLTYNDPTNGYQRREGTNEYIVRVKQRLRAR